MIEFLEEYSKGILALFFVGLAIGLCVLGWAYFLGPLSKQVQYNNFNSSPTHVNAVAQKFSDDCLQLATTSDPVAKKALEQDINQEAATVDLSKMDMPQGVRTCVNTAINDVNSKP